MSSERAEEPTTPDNQGGHPGQVLAAQREAMGWTVEQVADQLKLAVRQVVALEAGDYAALPSPAVTRGFVRAYAKLVRVDPAPLVAQIAIESQPAAEANPAAIRRPSPASFSQAKFPSHGKRSSLPLGWIAAAVAVAAVAAGAWHFGLIPLGQRAEPATVAAPAATAPAAADAHGSATETLQNPSVPLISVPGPASAQAEASGAASAPAAAAPAAGPVVNVPGTTATGAPPTTVPAAPANPVTAQSPAQAAATPAAAAPAGAGTLVFTVREDAWIEVKPTKGGKDMIKRLVRAGSTETLNIDQPVRIIVGNPGAVSASLRGAPVALPLVPGKTYSLVNVQ
ncbi:Cytoskeleton protein RodZ [Massilia sp. Bi118]|uniref:RodZ domain-containing protein n=1 Tax=Massilia sp. Bi118 TaxID=2822346 RepID=UPI001DDDF657|nr:RodZ domain-containing protein [Massilia sp. Bi118]CAH0314515.1 Cytoskeleton protein RodZ [Massilia sp. Bi118]